MFVLTGRVLGDQLSAFLLVTRSMELETVCQSDTAMSLIYAESDSVFLLHKNTDDLSEAACYSSSFSLLR